MRRPCVFARRVFMLHVFVSVSRALLYGYGMARKHAWRVGPVRLMAHRAVTHCMKARSRTRGRMRASDSDGGFTFSATARPRPGVPVSAEARGSQSGPRSGLS